MKMYFKGGKGIKNPVDFNGIEIKVDDILTSACFDPFFNEEFYKKNYPAWTKEDIENRKNRATYKVKWNEKGFFYAEGINQELYLHDFRFEYTKVVLHITRIFTPDKGWHDLKVYSSEEVLELLEKAKEIGIDEIIKTVKI